MCSRYLGTWLSSSLVLVAVSNAEMSIDMRVSIFVVDDQPAFRNALAKQLSHHRHRVREFASGEEMLEAFKVDVPDLIVLDLKLPGISGVEVLRALRTIPNDSVVVMLTAYGTVEDAVEAMKLGAFDFLIKTVDLESMEPVINRALDWILMRRRIAYAAESEADRYGLSNMIANSPAMRSLLVQIRELANNSKAPVLLTGETGTGKEFFARVIHSNSVRAKGPFVKVSCTSLSPQRFERDIFGYERGAFAGAERRKLGLLDQVETGTLFLDEIGDLDLTMQGKVLGIVQDRSFRRLGGVDDIVGDFRVIASSYRNLREEVSAGRFREDLFFHINVGQLTIPPLRDRTSDILPLTKHFMIKSRMDLGKEVNDIDPKAIATLERYSFPGNVRELQNLVERAMMLCAGTTLTPGDFPGAH